MLDGLDKNAKLDMARKLFVSAMMVDRNFQKEAREDFAYRDGDQWTKEERAVLEEQLRPALTMNVIKSSVDLVMGINDDTRIRYKATPVDPTDGFLCEIVNKVDNWVTQNYDIDGEEDDAAESATICGRGFVGVDFEIDPKNLGHIRLVNVSIPIHEVKKDPTSRKKDLSDSQYIFWDKWLNESDFIVRYPKLKNQFKDLISGNTMLMPDMVESKDSGISDYDTDVGSDTSDYDREFDAESFYDKSESMIRVIHMEYWQHYERFYAFNPATGKQEEFNKEDLANLKKVYPLKFGRPFEYVTVMDKKVKWYQFVGDKVLFDGDSPIPFDGFSIVPCFAYSDVSKRTGNHFGIVRLMKDPQKEINKRWSQTLNLLNNQVQPGIIAEQDAFVDMNQAEQALKTPGEVAIAQSGSIAGKKFMVRDVPAFPSAPMQLEQFSEVILRKITGINPDLLGQDRGRQEPGVVIRLRQQQGLTLLKPLFTSIRMLRKGTYQRRLSIIMKYMPDDQILQILGENGRYIIQNGMVVDKQAQRMAPIRALKELKYNIEPEEAPGNKSQRMLELSIYSELMQAGFQVDPKVVIKKLDLPEEERLQWIQYIEGMQKSQMEMAEKNYQLEMAKVQAGMQSTQMKVSADSQIKQAKVVNQKQKDDDKRDLEYDRLRQDNVKNLRDINVRNRQVDAQIYVADRAKNGN